MNLSPMPTPSPSPVLVEVVADAGATPWWGVPTVAGAFLLIGGFLTYLYGRYMEREKADRAQKEKLEEEIFSTALALLTAGDNIRTFGLIALNRSPLQNWKRAQTEGMPLVDAFTAAVSRFIFTMPLDFEEAVQGYMGWTVMVATPPFQREGQELSLNKQALHQREIINKLRSLRGLSPLAHDKAPDIGAVRPEDLLDPALIADRQAEVRYKEERAARQAAASDRDRPAEETQPDAAKQPATAPEDDQAPSS